MRTKLAVFLAGLALVAMAVPAVAHHAVGAEYDASKVVKLTGTVSKIEWTNPHARIYFDVKGDDGKVTTWNVELAATKRAGAPGLHGEHREDRRDRDGRRQPGPFGRERRECALGHDRRRQARVWRRRRQLKALTD